ncbi:MAG: 30S ribosomal protein S4 [Candidatus Omnitrophica bacterium]|nr:30S ribosomal protein S4 [Candidatus Omnitrophota bacterium]MBD3268785.1 30S ribosomal protein S4 [Candidatus Omnitrophota bacterium]
MGRYTEAKCKLCRRAEMKLFLKGVRCTTEKCSFAKRPVPPGMQHRRKRGKPSYYALQLREKQKAKNAYNMLERQFRRFYDVASRRKGASGRVLIQMLERRLDNVMYRSLFALSRNQSRQLVRHGFVFVDGQRVDIPSYLVKDGQEIEIRAHDSLKKDLKSNVDINSKERSCPTWMQADNENLKIKIVRLPEKEDLVVSIDEQLIVELYSK